MSNFFGLYDIHGNVSEMVSDGDYRYPEADSPSQAIVNPTIPSPTHRIVRGGSCREFARSGRLTERANFDAKYASYEIGFRLVRTTYE